MNEINIIDYAKRNTVPNQPLQRKVVQAYMESLLNSNQIQSLIKYIKPSMIPTLGEENKLAFLNSLSRDTSLFQNIDSLKIIVYSLGKKDLALFEMISETYLNGYVIEGSSSHIYGGYYPYTDMDVEDQFTDGNSLSDMDTSTPIINFYSKFYESLEEYELFLDKVGLYLDDDSKIQSYNELEQGISEANMILKITKPARVNVSFTNIPLIFVGATEMGDGHGFAYGIDLEENPFDVGSNLELLRNVNESAFTNYNSDVCSIQYLSDSIDSFFWDMDDCTIIARLCYSERVSKPQNSSGEYDPTKIWGTIFTNCIVDDTDISLVGAINCAKLQSTLQNYAFWLVMYLPK